MRPIYLDYMATTPVDERVASQMMQMLTLSGSFGNPASNSHVYGETAARIVEEARAHVSALIHAPIESIVWTSGATEANNLALKGAAHFYARKGKHLITLATEHKSVLDPCKHLEREGYEVTYLLPKPDGLLSLEDLRQAIRPDTILVSVMHVNNEIGVIQDLSSIAKCVRPHGILFHVDAAQSLGKIPVDVVATNVDLMSFSAHKLYGPKGIGALYVRQNPRVRLEPLLHGGGHEHGLRSGTLATHQIVGMGEACRIALDILPEESARILAMREQLWEGLREIPGIHLHGSLIRRVPGNLNISFDEVDGASLLFALKDLALSQGSACTAEHLEPSYVLKALQVSHLLAHHAVRISLGRYTTEADIEKTITLFKKEIARLRAT